MDFINKLKLTPGLPSNHEEVFDILFERYGKQEDPWGLNLEKARKTLRYLWPLYKDYFQVRVFGKENVPNNQIMAIANHSGQIAIDALLLSTAFATEIRKYSCFSRGRVWSR